MLALLLAGAAALQQPAPLPEGAAVAWRGGSATEREFAGWLARALGPQDEEVASALEHVLQIRLVETEAAARRLSVTPAEVEARLAEAKAAVEAAGYDLDQELKARGMSLTEFRKLLGDSLLHERLARADLGLAPDAPVSSGQLQGWTRDRIAAILAANQPAGELAIDSGLYRVSYEEVGGTMLHTVAAARLRDYAGQMALETALPAWAEAQQLALTDDVLLAEIEWRRRRVAENPNYQGATYEGLLAARGSSVDAVLAGSEIRIAGWLRLYARTLWPDAWFEKLDAAGRRALDDEFGAAREVSWLLLHAKPVKQDADLDLDLREASAELLRWKAEMKTPRDFAHLAERYSEHDASRRRGGLYGTVHRREPGADPLLCAAAFAAAIGEVSEPVEVEGGMALVLVTAERPAPPEAELRELVRRAHQDEARSRFLAGLELRTVWDEAPAR